tara:strand:+ start:426 stop:644 length:219 start_codon:yes stop_codon:yes gene_type:complete
MKAFIVMIRLVQGGFDDQDFPESSLEPEDCLENNKFVLQQLRPSISGMLQRIKRTHFANFIPIFPRKSYEQN